MYIKEVEFENFKCFKEKCVLPFSQGFTVILGPNGAGKTSLLDSIKFVCGGLENTSNLINSNSLKARVKITFDNDIVIEKMLEKENKISYFLNGQTASEDKISEVLKDLKLTTIDNCGADLSKSECEKYAKELKEKSKNEQVIVVSLRKDFMTAADRMIGVSENNFITGTNKNSNSK